MHEIIPDGLLSKSIKNENKLKFMIQSIRKMYLNSFKNGW